MRDQAWKLTVIVVAVLVAFVLLTVTMRDERHNKVAVPTFVQQTPAGHQNLKSLRDIYLKTLKVTLTGYAFKSKSIKVGAGEIAIGNQAMNDDARKRGADWPSVGYTMIGTIGLENVQELLEHVIQDGVPGDFLEAGVWRGGASMFAKAIMNSYNQQNRQTWVCDSFEGLPPATQAKDNDHWSKMKALAVSKEIVRGHFDEFFLLDETVHFIQGYFVYSLPCLRKTLTERNNKIAVLRADGDMYESLMDILFNLYEFVPVGGYIIIDDWGIQVAKKAVQEFRAMHDIKSTIFPFRGISMYWKVESKIPVKYSWYEEFMKTRKLDASKKQC
ncbi:unnamed protein product [Owenia fusiformis]|uniref:Macrocin O-methyltransferase n=1 Tax=Owenia fusiformis TaxID=6347 RepID=A0A8S4PVQ8_OWEFU|nr:unnamed protein product [Owenia fusiformis]